MNPKFDKSLVVITGASSGIGAATARAFSAAGYPLLLIARRLDRLNTLKLPRTLIAQVDVTNVEALEQAIQNAEGAYGPTGFLINNAGLMLLGQIADQNPNEWEKMFQVNVMGLLNGVRSVLKGMISRQSGTIVNIGSIAGRKTFPNHAAYCGTKFAVHAMTENIREEVSNANVRLITIAPGAVETELLSHTTSETIKDSYEEWKDSMGGAIQPDDIARAILFACMQPQNVCVREIVIAATRQGP